PKYTMSMWMGFSQIKQGGEDSFLGHSEQEYPQYLFEEVMSDISSRDGKDFKKPSSVEGSDPDSLSVKGHSDSNTTNKSTHGDSDSSTSSN
ncbi:penicillin-binding protein, partial [Staphylococcus capitis]